MPDRPRGTRIGGLLPTPSPNINAYLAVTDLDWFDFLAAQARLGDVDEVNFWYPKAWGGRFGVLTDGQPLLFKLKSPRNAVAGGGYFRHYTEIPLSMAWEAFGWKNGAISHEEVWRRITRLRRENPEPWDDPVIGCVLLAEPFFWEPELWIHDLPGWHANIQRGRTYDLRSGAGQSIWSAVSERLLSGFRGSELQPQLEPPGGYGEPAFSPRRMGQGIFRTVITDAYGRRCAVSSERALPALEAAHIRPFSEVQEHSVGNGVLLRSDIHRLFDSGYLTITPELRVEASSRMRGDFNDGDNYLRLHGARVRVPDDERLHPDPEALRWHNERRYRR